MSSERRAVIDVGTNSIKLLIADVAGGELLPILEDSQQTRLGRGFYETHRLQSDAIHQSALTVGSFAEVARRHGAGSLRVIATSAARDARNAADLVGALEAAAKVPVDIISGEQEAEWAFQGVTTDPALHEGHLLIMDLGGGSTEFVAGYLETPHLRHSFQLGTVRLLETISLSDPPAQFELGHCRQTVREFLRSRVLPIVEPTIVKAEGVDWHSNTILVGTGGTATLLGRIEAGLESYDRARLDGLRLTAERVRWQVEHLWSLPLAARKQVVGLPPNRADVILTGAVIYEAVLEVFRIPELRISTRGLRWAALLS